jgi:hypothetical protein
VLLLEAEPNDTIGNANPIDRLLDETIVVDGAISTLGDRDWFAIPLQQGDVVGVALRGFSQLDTMVRLVNASGELMIAIDDSLGDGKYALPPESPLPRTPPSTTDSEIYYVSNASGLYHIEVAASGDGTQGRYSMEMVVARPGLEKQPVGTRQTLFLDFDGAKVNMSDFGWHGTRQFSPLADALPDWGLTAAEEDAVIDAILVKVTDKLSSFVRANGLNGDFASTGIPGQFDIEILNSRDHADEFGTNPLVSRIVVGLINDPAFTPLGISQYIDVGNFKTDDQAIAKVDYISGALTRFPTQPPATTIDFVAAALGFLISHEAGHIFGCWHSDQTATDPFAGTPNLMDPDGITTLGPDLIFGSADDIDLQLGVDSYRLVESRSGRNDTLNTVAFGLSTGTQADATSLAIRRALPQVSTNVIPVRLVTSALSALGTEADQTPWAWIARNSFKRSRKTR